MSIKVGDKDLFPYLGDYRPVNIYKGEHKVAGWKWTEQSGKELLFENTYNDFVEVEVDGKSYQGGEPSPDYPIEIHSLNDFDVVSSVGKRNLVLNSKRDISATHADILGRNYRPLLEGETYTLSFDVKASTNTRSRRVFLNNSITINKYISITTEYQRHSVTFKYIKSDYLGRQIYPTIYPSDSTGLSWTNFKIEGGENATPYSPAPEDITENDNHPLIDKINLSLSEPLRSVGDVKDRLFRDSDGLWKIERNVGETQLGASNISNISIGASNNVAITRKIDNIKYYTSSYNAPLRSTHHKQMEGNSASAWSTIENRGTATINTVASMWISVDKENIDTVEKARNWFEAQKTAGTPVIVQYALENPTIETLDQNLQDKLNNLRSFQGSNYVYTVINDKTDVISETLKPTLHARLKVKDI